MRVQLVAAILAASALCGSAFMPATPARLPTLTARAAPARRSQHVVEMGVGEAIQAYVDIWVPTFKGVLVESGSVPPAVVKWLHGANMGIVLSTMATFGTYLGYQIRGGNGEMVVTGKTARQLHPILMGLAFLFFFLGGQGGLVLLSVQDQPILQSKHAITGAIGISLLLAQGLLPKLFKSEDPDAAATARTVHTYLGSATMALLFVHGYLGFQLGNSF